MFPEGFHLGARDVGESRALLEGEALHFAEAAREFGARFFGGDFWVDIEEASKVDSNEEDVADLGFDAGRVFIWGGEEVAEFAGFLVEFSKDAVDIVPIKTDTSGFASELVAFEKSGDSAGDAVE